MAAWHSLGQFILGGEAVVLDDVIADFDALPSRKHDEEVRLCAFDVLAVGGKDLRKLPLSMRKMDLEQLLARRPEGVFINPWRVAMAPPAARWAVVLLPH